MSQSPNKFQQDYKLNENNYIITKNDVEAIFNNIYYEANKKYSEKRRFIKVVVNNLDNYKKAFTHESYLGEQNYINTNPPNEKEMKRINNDEKLKELYNNVPKESNERLEFIGDRFIDTAVVDYISELYPNENEHFLTKLKIKLVKTEMLSHFASVLNFDKYILLSSFHETLENKNQGRNNPKILENCFEAFIGAIVKDNNRRFVYEIIYQFIRSLIELYVDLDLVINTNDNSKDSLIRYFKSIKEEKPDFYDVYNDGKPNNRTYTVGIIINKDYYKNLKKSEKTKIKSYEEKIKSIISLEKSNRLDLASKASKHDIECIKTGCNSCIANNIVENIDNFVKIIESKEKYVIGMGMGNSKKKAQQEASKYSLENINVDSNF